MTEKKSDKLSIFVGDDKLIMAQSSLSEAQLNLISRRTPTTFIKRRKGRGGKEYDYVDIGYVTGVLNAVFGFDWSVEVMEHIINNKAMQIALRVRLKVHLPDGRDITKDAWGGSDIKLDKSGKSVIDFADDLKSSQSDAIKKAASMLGVAWDVYSGQTNTSEGATEPTAEDKYPQYEELVLSDGRKVRCSKFEAYKYFEKIKEVMGETLYRSGLGEFGYEKKTDIMQGDCGRVFRRLIEIHRAVERK